jgi:hypothetical protein
LQCQAWAEFARLLLCFVNAISSHGVISSTLQKPVSCC